MGVSEVAEMPAEYRKVQIADVGAALQLLSEVYSDARRALAEFISNAADAFVLAEHQRISRKWRCSVHLGRRQITVTDNGCGITRERLLELPTQVTLSAKKGDLEQKGHKAIGLLAFASFCREMRLVSRAEGEQQTFEARWTQDSLANPEANPVLIDVARDHPLSGPGTQVVLSGIVEDRLHQLNVNKLVDFLQAEFSPDLRAKRYELVVHDGKEARPVQPSAYSGVPFPKLNLQTEKGENIQLELYLTQKPIHQRVGLFVRGKQVLPNLADQSEFSEGPWKAGRVAGEVRCNWLRPTTGRSGIEHGDEWRRFVESLKGIEHEIQAELDRIAEEQRTRQVHRIFKEINQALASVLPTLRWDELPKSAVGRGETDVFASGTEGAGRSVGEGPAWPRGSGAVPSRPRRSRLIDPSKPRRVGGSAATGFNFREIDFEPDFRRLRSRFIPVQSLIEVNSSHADYSTEREDDRRLRNYIARLVVKEITLLNFRDMGEVEIAERMIELETALNRQIE
jgi:hypothetical protein